MNPMTDPTFSSFMYQRLQTSKIVAPFFPLSKYLLCGGINFFNVNLCVFSYETDKIAGDFEGGVSVEV